jgi:predicted acylesterase/phospholipase RssA
MITINDNEMLAIVLMGGGKRGKFQIEPLKKLDELGLLKRTNILVGTSIGGATVATLAKNWNNNPVQALEKLWDGIKKNTDIYNGKLDVWGFLKMVITKCKSILNQQGLYKITKNNFAGVKLKDLPVNVAITATNLNMRRPEYFSTKTTPEMDLQLLVNMTTAIPGAFQYQVYNGDKYVDGGALNNIPIKTAIELGATKIIMIGTGANDLGRIDIKDDGMSVLLATLNTLLYYPESEMFKTIKKDFPNVEILYLYADKDTGNALDFGQDDLKEYGREMAEKYWTDEVLEEWAK